MARDLKKERRDRPKKVLKLKKSIYGIPDAGCGLTQSEMDPCIFYKIDKNATTKGRRIPGGDDMGRRLQVLRDS